jgi:hypothetical protein
LLQHLVFVLNFITEHVYVVCLLFKYLYRSFLKEPRRFSTANTKVSHWACYWASLIHIFTACFIILFSFVYGLFNDTISSSNSWSQWPRGLRYKPWSLGRWYCGFESHLRHGRLPSSIPCHSLVTLSFTLYSLVTEKT